MLLESLWPMLDCSGIVVDYEAYKWVKIHSESKVLSSHMIMNSIN